MEIKLCIIDNDNVNYLNKIIKRSLNLNDCNMYPDKNDNLLTMKILFLNSPYSYK